MRSPFDISDKVILVTGSSRGIGRGVAEHLGAGGASVAVHARSIEALEPVTARLRELGAAVLPVVADVLEADQLQAAVAAVGAHFGRLDGVVANVGGAAHVPAERLDAPRFRRQLDLNLTSAFLTVRAAHPLLRASHGAVVLISATAALNPTPQFAAYGAAKAGLEHLTRSLAAEWGPEVRVNCVSPGLIRTEGSFKALFQGSEELASRAGRTTAVGRIGEPEDIALACQYLLSAAASFVSGAVLAVDGGPVEGPAQRILGAIQGKDPHA